MKLTKLVWVGVILLFALIVYVVVQPKSPTGNNNSAFDKKNTQSYVKQLVTQRKNKDEYLRTNTDSPIENKSTFTGLSYYAGNPDYRITARFEPFADKTQRLVIPLSDGSEEVYEKTGHAVFKIQGEVCRLLIVKHDQTHSVLFKDRTSGKTTYGGGRYIDLDEADFDGNQLMLDFNKAYNPYCVYNHSYACPLPPAENVLPVAIEAGEKMPASGQNE